MSTARKALIGGAVVALLVVVAFVFGRPSSPIAEVDLVEARRLVGVMETDRGLTEVRCDPVLNHATMPREYWVAWERARGGPSARENIVKVIARVCLSDAGNARTVLRDERGATLDEVR